MSLQAGVSAPPCPSFLPCRPAVLRSWHKWLYGDMVWEITSTAKSLFFCHLVFICASSPQGNVFVAHPPLFTGQCKTSSFIHSTGFSGLRYLPSSSTSACSICSLSIFVRITIAHYVLPGKMLAKAHGINQPLQLATTWQTARGAGSGERTGHCWVQELLCCTVVATVYVAYGSRFGHRWCCCCHYLSYV